MCVCSLLALPLKFSLLKEKQPTIHKHVGAIVALDSSQAGRQATGSFWWPLVKARRPWAPQSATCRDTDCGVLEGPWGTDAALSLLWSQAADCGSIKPGLQGGELCNSDVI